MALIQLPNGDWLDAWAFVSIRSQPGRGKFEGTGTVIVDQISGHTHYFNTAEVSHAEVTRDALAENVNAARKEHPVSTERKDK